jgi:hypothetical protein
MEEIQLLLVGSVFIIIGLLLYLSTISIRKNGVLAQAKVIKHKFEDDEDGGMIYEVFQFKDKNGVVQYSKSVFGSSFKMYEKGESIEIVYDENNPKKVLPNNRYLIHLYLIPILIGATIIIVHLMISKP